MLHTFLHVLPGLVLLVATTLAVLRLGDRDQKLVMTGVLLCWIGSAIGQVLSGQIVAPVIAADAIFAIGLLWFAWRRPSWWIWALFAVEGLRLVLHASQFQMQRWVPYAWLNNTLSVAGLIVLVWAAAQHARRRNIHSPLTPAFPGVSGGGDEPKRPRAPR